MKRNENFITLHSVINGQKLDLYPKTVAQQVYVNGNTLNKELKKQKAENAEIQEVGKPSFIKKVLRKIKRILKLS